MTEQERMAKIRELKAEVETNMLRVSEIVLEAAKLGATFYFEHQSHGDSNYLQFCTKVEETLPEWLKVDPEKAVAMLDSIFANGTKH